MATGLRAPGVASPLQTQYLTRSNKDSIVSSLYALPFYDFDLRASHARTLLPAALASVPFGFVLVRVRVRMCSGSDSYISVFGGWFLLPSRTEFLSSKSKVIPTPPIGFFYPPEPRPTRMNNEMKEATEPLPTRTISTLVLQCRIVPYCSADQIGSCAHDKSMNHATEIYLY